MGWLAGGDDGEGNPSKVTARCSEGLRSWLRFHGSVSRSCCFFLTDGCPVHHDDGGLEVQVGGCVVAAVPPPDGAFRGPAWPAHDGGGRLPGLQGSFPGPARANKRKQAESDFEGPSPNPKTKLIANAVPLFSEIVSRSGFLPTMFAQGREARLSKQERVPFACVRACDEQVFSRAARRGCGFCLWSCPPRHS